MAWRPYQIPDSQGFKIAAAVAPILEIRTQCQKSKKKTIQKNSQPHKDLENAILGK